MKSNKIQKEERIRFVMDLISKGHMTFEIVDICSKEWGVGRRQIEKYLTIVYRFLTTSLKEKDKDKILLEYDRLIHKYEMQGEVRYAMQYRQMRDKIMGLYINKTDITTGGDKLPGAVINIINPNV